MSYSELARRPEQYSGQPVTVRGKVIQALYSAQSVTLRINITRGNYDFWRDTVLVTYTVPPSAPRILENDVVQVWGTYVGIQDYKSIFGATVQVPMIRAIALS